MGRLPYYTTMAGARALVEALRELARGSLEVRPLQAYLADPEKG
jgi:carbamoyl-phosphate synthase large subunit